MQRGYVITSEDLKKVLCLNQHKTGVAMSAIDSTTVLNSAICLSDLTEAQNVLRRMKNNDGTKSMCKNAVITNVARLYKNFY